MQKRFYVYILICNDKSYYVGITHNLDKRLIEHQEGIDKFCYTHSRRPVRLIYFEEFQKVNEAIFREKQIKGWSRAKKQALINGDIGRLIKLSKNRIL